MTLPMVRIEWVDSAQAAPGWQWLAALETPPIVRCVSVGFLVKDDEDEKCIAISIGNADDVGSAQVSGVISIPARCVVEIKRLGVAATSSSSPAAESEQTPQAT